jgi:cytochrome c
MGHAPLIAYYPQYAANEDVTMLFQFKLQNRIAALAICVCLVLPVLAADAVTHAMQAAYEPQRLVLFKTHSNSQTEVPLTMPQAQQSCGKLATQFGSKPPAPYEHDTAFSTSADGLLLINLAQSSSALALDKGCYSCHGSLPRNDAPTFDQLAKKYAKYQGQTTAAAKLAEKLREKHMLGGVKAHEQLTQENALQLIQWIIEGAK